MALKTIPSVVVTGPNTPTPLSTTRLVAHSLIATAAAGNAAPVWIGDSSVNSTPGGEAGTPIAPGGSFSLTEEMSPNGENLATIYISSTSGTAKVHLNRTEG